MAFFMFKKNYSGDNMNIKKQNQSQIEKFSNELKDFKNNHNKKSYFHKLNLDELQMIYGEYYSNINHLILSRKICKDFDYCDEESLIITLKFFGE